MSDQPGRDTTPCNLTIEELIGSGINVLEACPICKWPVGRHLRAQTTKAKADVVLAAPEASATASINATVEVDGDIQILDKNSGLFVNASSSIPPPKAALTAPKKMKQMSIGAAFKYTAGQTGTENLILSNDVATSLGKKTCLNCKKEFFGGGPFATHIKSCLEKNTHEEIGGLSSMPQIEKSAVASMNNSNATTSRKSSIGERITNSGTRGANSRKSWSYAQKVFSEMWLSHHNRR